jgi:hypothetical protein
MLQSGSEEGKRKGPLVSLSISGVEPPCPYTAVLYDAVVDV